MLMISFVLEILFVLNLPFVLEFLVALLQSRLAIGFLLKILPIVASSYHGSSHSCRSRSS